MERNSSLLTCVTLHDTELYDNDSVYNEVHNEGNAFNATHACTFHKTRMEFVCFFHMGNMKKMINQTSAYVWISHEHFFFVLFNDFRWKRGCFLQNQCGSLQCLYAGCIRWHTQHGLAMQSLALLCNSIVLNGQLHYNMLCRHLIAPCTAVNNSAISTVTNSAVCVFRRYLQ